MRRTRRAALLLACGATALAACGGGAPTPGAPAASAVPSGSAALPSASAAPAVDTGPLLTRRSGSTRLERLAPARASAKASEAIGGAWLVTVPLGEAFRDSRVVRIDARAAGSLHAVAYAEALTAPEAVVRIARASGAPSALTLVVSALRPDARRDQDAGFVQEITVDGLGSTARGAQLLPRFQRAAADAKDGPGGLNAFARARLRALADRQQPHPASDPLGGRAISGGDLDQLMDFYTGKSALDEALQYDRGLAVGVAPRSARTIDPSTVQGLEATRHPYARLLAALPGSPKPVIEPLARRVPADTLYAHFHDLGQLAALARELDERASDVLQALEQAPGGAWFLERYERQLVLERSGLAERLGNVAVEGVALLVGDPYLHEGTDVTFVMRLKSRALALAALESFASHARAERADLVRSSYDSGGVKVQLLATPDGQIAQHRAEVDDLLFISNSRAGLHHALLAARGQEPVLADAPDFAYLRTRIPFDPTRETGFVYVGDAAVARVAGPRSKILEARRLRAGAELGAVNNAALLYGELEGRPPAQLDDLTRGGLLTSAELKHSSGEAIAFDPRHGASSAWGRGGALTPIADLDLGKISVSERDAYERFAAGYQSYWRGMIDPAGFRISRSEDGRSLEIDARILPLIDASEYGELLRDAAGAYVERPAALPGLSLTLAIGENSSLRRAGERLARSVVSGRDFGFDFLGGWAAAGLGDRSGAWDLALAEGDIPELGPRRSSDERLGAALRAPAWVAVQIKSRIALGVALAALRGWAEQAAPMAHWSRDETYRGVEITRVDASDEVDDGAHRREVTLRYGVARDVFIVSLDLATLRQQIDAVLDGQGARKAASGMMSLLDARSEPGGWLARALRGLLEEGVVRATVKTREAQEGLIRSGLLVQLSEREQRDVASAYLGFVPASPAGGTLGLDADGLVRHSLYGSATEPALPSLDAPDAPLARALGSLVQLRAGAGFEGSGSERELHTQIALSWR